MPTLWTSQMKRNMAAISLTSFSVWMLGDDKWKDRGSQIQSLSHPYSCVPKVNSESTKRILMLTGLEKYQNYGPVLSSRASISNMQHEKGRKNPNTHDSWIITQPTSQKDSQRNTYNHYILWMQYLMNITRPQWLYICQKIQQGKMPPYLLWTG